MLPMVISFRRNLECELEKSEEKKKDLDEIMKKINDELQEVQNKLKEKENAMKKDNKYVFFDFP